MALVHEAAESDIMTLPPRHPQSKLVSGRLLLQVLWIGTLETIFAFTNFSWFMKRNGFQLSDWMLTFNTWNVSGDNGVNEILLTGQSVFFMTLVILQIGNLLTTRTRRIPIIPVPARFNKVSTRPSLRDNKEPAKLILGFIDPERHLHILSAISFSILWLIIFTEGPGCQNIFNTRHVPGEYWGMAMLMAIALFLTAELRKVWVLIYPDGLLAKCAW